MKTRGVGVWSSDLEVGVAKISYAMCEALWETETEAKWNETSQGPCERRAE